MQKNNEGARRLPGLIGNHRKKLRHHFTINVQIFFCISITAMILCNCSKPVPPPILSFSPRPNAPSNPYGEVMPITTGQIILSQRGDTVETVSRITSPDAEQGDNFGEGLALDGDTLVVGNIPDTPFHDQRSKGFVNIFSRWRGDWHQAATLTSPTLRVGAAFGHSLAVSKNILVVGAPGHGTQEKGWGEVYVFEKIEERWTETQKLIPSTPKPRSFFGHSLALTEETLLIGAPGQNARPGLPDQYGAIYVFERTPEGWVERQKLARPDVKTPSGFGSKVVVEGEVALVGSTRWEARSAMVTDAVLHGLGS